jgi:hypothetical protein
MSAVELKTQLENLSFEDLISYLKSRAAEFTRTYQNMQAIGPSVAHYPDLYPEYNRLMSRANTIVNTIESAKATANNAYNWLRSTLGLDGMAAVQQGLSGLGFIPAALIPIAIKAAIIAAVVAVVYWITDAVKVLTAHNEMIALKDDPEVTRLRQEGYSLKEAINITQGRGASSWIKTAGKEIILPVALVGGGAFILAQLLKPRKR